MEMHSHNGILFCKLFIKVCIEFVRDSGLHKAPRTSSFNSVCDTMCINRSGKWMLICPCLEWKLPFNFIPSSFSLARLMFTILLFGFYFSSLCDAFSSLCDTFTYSFECLKSEFINYVSIESVLCAAINPSHLQCSREFRSTCYYQHSSPSNCNCILQRIGASMHLVHSLLNSIINHLNKFCSTNSMLTLPLKQQTDEHNFARKT